LTREAGLWSAQMGGRLGLVAILKSIMAARQLCINSISVIFPIEKIFHINYPKGLFMFRDNCLVF
jgi:hypothetical protein